MWRPEHRRRSGNGSCQFDRLAVGGAAVLGGRLEVDLMDGLAPGLGERFPFVVTTNLSGEFSQVSVPPRISITYTNTGVVPVAGPAQRFFRVRQP